MRRKKKKEKKREKKREKKERKKERIVSVASSRIKKWKNAKAEARKERRCPWIWRLMKTMEQEQNHYTEGPDRKV